MFSCDSLWCCWSDLMTFIGHALWVLRWVGLSYALLYAAGAASFLLLLRLQSSDGRLVVRKKSWAYMFAHPMRYGDHRSQTNDIGNICGFYARMFNMLIFVWPFLLIWFLLVATIGNMLTMLLAATFLWPDLRSDGFIRARFLFGDGPKPIVLLWLVTGLIVLAVLRFHRLMHVLGAIGWATLCLIPALAAAAAVLTVFILGRSPKENAVNATLEVVAAKKDRFCKMVEFR